MTRTKTKLDKLLSNVVFASNGCWLWTKAISEGWYGVISFDGKTYKAHKILYEIIVGPVEDGLELDHLCREPSCVNPFHLEQVTHRENILRGTGCAATNAAKTHCKNGHALDGINLYINNRGDRVCKTCKRQRDREYHKRKR